MTTTASSTQLNTPSSHHHIVCPILQPTATKPTKARKEKEMKKEENTEVDWEDNPKRGVMRRRWKWRMKRKAGKRSEVRSYPLIRLSLKKSTKLQRRRRSEGWRGGKGGCLLRIRGRGNGHITHDILVNLTKSRADNTFSTPRTWDWLRRESWLFITSSECLQTTVHTQHQRVAHYWTALGWIFFTKISL